MTKQTRDPDFTDVLSRRDFVAIGLTVSGGLFEVKTAGLHSLFAIRPGPVPIGPVLGFDPGGSPLRRLGASPGVAYRYEFGVALHEVALNIASAALRVSHPEIFSQSTDIPIKPATRGPAPTPGNTLTLYSIAREPLAFRFAPDRAIPLEDDTFFAQVDVSFTLTDSQFGTITRIGAKLQAKGGLVIDGGRARFGLLDFKVVELRGEGARLDADRLDVTSSVDQAYGGGEDTSLGRTFRAIVNYLINVFLEDALKKSVTEFPVSPLNDIVTLPGLGVLPLSEARIRNNSLHAFVGRPLAGPVPFPAPPADVVHLRFGATQQGIDRVLAALAVEPQVIEPSDHGDFRVSGEMHLARVRVDLAPATRDMRLQLHFGGRVDLWFQVKIPIFGGYIRAKIPIPISDNSHYAGAVEPRAHVGPVAPDGAGEVILAIHPKVNFWDRWYLYIETDYRRLIANALRDAVNEQRDRLLGDKFCKFPLIGWLVCGTISVVDDVLGYVLGALLDAIVGTYVNGFLNTVGRLVAAYFALFDRDKLQINAARIDQKALLESLGTTIRAARTEILHNGVTSELQLQAWLSDVGLPVPPPPVSLPPIVPRPVPPLPPQPGFSPLPEFAPGAFAPVIPLPVPAWTSGTTEEYDVELHYVARGDRTRMKKVVTYSVDDGQWLITQSVSDAEGTYTSLTNSRYAEGTIAPISTETMTTTSGSTVVERVVFGPADRVSARVRLPGGGDWESDISLRKDIPVDMADSWILRWAYAPLRQDATGVFSRPDLEDPKQFANWLRIVPVRVTISSSTEADGQGGTIPVWVIEASDDAIRMRGTVAKSAPGLRELTITTDEAQMVLRRIR